MTAIPTADAAAAALGRYLTARGTGLCVTACAAISGGYETFIYRVTLAGGDGASSLLRGVPLILRVYQGPGMVERSAWEAAVIGRVRAAGVPAPAVRLYEPDPRPLGGPFLLLDHISGARMDAAMGAGSTLGVARMIRNFARMQARIHRIDWPEGRPLAPGERAAAELGPFVWARERLALARTMLQQRRLDALLPVVDWLEVRRGAVADLPEVLIHGDYHPLNVFIDGARISAVIDWGSGGFAYAHEDIGWTSLIIATASAADAEEDAALERFRTLGHKAYLAAQWEASRTDRVLLRYGEVYAGLRWLLIFLPSLLPDAGPPVLNPDARSLTTPRYVRRVLAFIEQRTRLTLELESRGLPGPNRA